VCSEPSPSWQSWRASNTDSAQHSKKAIRPKVSTTPNWRVMFLSASNLAKITRNNRLMHLRLEAAQSNTAACIESSLVSRAIRTYIEIKGWLLAPVVMERRRSNCPSMNVIASCIYGWMSLVRMCFLDCIFEWWLGQNKLRELNMNQTSTRARSLKSASSLSHSCVTIWARKPSKFSESAHRCLRRKTTHW